MSNQPPPNPDGPNRPSNERNPARRSERSDLTDDLDTQSVMRKARAEAGTTQGSSLAGRTTESEPSTTGSPSSFPNIAGYEILREIHRGGQGVVYQAVQKATKRKVAIKLLLDGPYASKAARRRFEREIELIAQLKHPNIISIFHSGETTDGRQFCVMDYVRGLPLDQFVKENKLSPIDTVRLFSQICDAVGHAHSKGVIHRDLKPSNILVGVDSVPKVLDFGLAKQLLSREGTMISVTGQVVGTLPYMSPEQALGIPEQVDSRTDIYSLGVILYQVLTGKFPYEVLGNMRDVLDNILRAEPTRPSTIQRNLDNDVETILLKALAKEPESRYVSAGELGLDLGRFIQGEPISAKKASAWYVIRKRVRRHRRSIAIAALFPIVVGFSVTAALYVTSQNKRGPEPITPKSGNSLPVISVFQQMIDRSVDADIREPVPENSTLIDWDARVSINIAAEPTGLFPMNMQDTNDVTVCELIFERLFIRTPTLELRPNPHLVATIEDDESPGVKLVRLQEDVLWHDRTPFTAEDVVFSWEQTVHPDGTSSKRSQASKLIRVAAEEPFLVRFEFERPVSDWKRCMNFELISKVFYKEATRSGKLNDVALAKTPVGTGPFELDEWKPKQHIILTRFDEYRHRGNKPEIRGLKITWKDDDIRISAACRGDLDIVNLTHEDCDNWIDSDPCQQVGVVASIPTSAFYYVVWNFDRPFSTFLKDTRVRKAIAHSLNYNRVSKNATFNMAHRCFGPFGLDSKFFNPAIEKIGYDRKRAESLLDQAGWRVNSVGQRSKAPGTDGVAKELKFDLILFEGWKEAVTCADILKSELGKIGISIWDEKLDKSSYMDRLSQGEFDAAILRVEGSVQPEGWAALFKSTVKSNFGRYSNSEVDRIFDAQNWDVDEQAQIDRWQKFHAIIYDDQPVLFLFHETKHYAINRRLRGINFSPRGLFLFEPGVRDWWVERQ